MDEATIHAAIMAVNEALEKENSTETYNALSNPNTCLKHLDGGNAERYQSSLLQAKREKASRNQAGDGEGDQEEGGEANKERDVYDTMLTQVEIQKEVEGVNTAVKREEAEARRKWVSKHPSISPSERAF